MPTVGLFSELLPGFSVCLKNFSTFTQLLIYAPFAKSYSYYHENEEILHSVGIMLTRNDFKVSTKNKIDNFEQDIKGLVPDLILLDKTLGWADGCELS